MLGIGGGGVHVCVYKREREREREHHMLHQSKKPCTVLFYIIVQTMDKRNLIHALTLLVVHVAMHTKPLPILTSGSRGRLVGWTQSYRYPAISQTWVFDISLQISEILGTESQPWPSPQASCNWCGISSLSMFLSSIRISKGDSAQ